jgi:hypothetical protein
VDLDSICAWFSTNYSTIKDFAAPVATITAAVIAAGITAVFAWSHAKTARAQKDIALDRLRYDLFDKSYALYDATKQLIVVTLNESPKPNVDIAAETMPIHNRLREAPFFLPPAICEFIEATIADCDKYITGSLERRNPTYKATPDDMKDRVSLGVKLSDRLRELPHRFRPALSFTQLTRPT